MAILRGKKLILASMFLFFAIFIVVSTNTHITGGRPLQLGPTIKSEKANKCGLVDFATGKL